MAIVENGKTGMKRVTVLGRKRRARVDEMEAQRVRAPKLLRNRSTKGPVTENA